MRSLLCKRFRLLPPMTSTRSILHSISTTPLTSPHAFVHVILIKFISHSISSLSSNAYQYQYQYHTIPCDLPKICLILVPWCVPVHTDYAATETNGERYMYIKHVLLRQYPPKFPPGSFLLETKLSARYTKRLFWGVWPRRIFLGMSGNVCIY